MSEDNKNNYEQRFIKTEDVIISNALNDSKDVSLKSGDKDTINNENKVNYEKKTDDVGNGSAFRDFIYILCWFAIITGIAYLVISSADVYKNGIDIGVFEKNTVYGMDALERYWLIIWSLSPYFCLVPIGMIIFMYDYNKKKKKSINKDNEK